MRILKAAVCLLLAVVLGVSAPGCKKKSESNAGKTGKTQKGHVHPSEGPNKGKIIELGSEEYHAEFLHDKKAQTVTIYVLDSSAAKQVAVDAKEVVINVTHDGEPEQYKLPAKPVMSDPMGKSSRFELKDGELSHALTHNDANPKMSMLIGGKSFGGPIK